MNSKIPEYELRELPEYEGKGYEVLTDSSYFISGGVVLLDDLGKWQPYNRYGGHMNFGKEGFYNPEDAVVWAMSGS